jgi:hypothetical protein
MTRLLFVTAAFALLTTASLAQETPPPTQEATPPAESAAPAKPAQAAMELSDLRRVKDGDRMVTPWNLKVEDVEDADVDGPDGKEMGEIEKVLEDTNGEIRAVVLEYGGFLGLGAKQVIVALDQLQPAKGHRFTTNLTEEQLNALPAWTK